MRFTGETSSDGVTEQLFTLGEIPGVLWTPDDAPSARPLILMGHGGGQHKKAPGIAARAHRFATEGGYAVAAVDAPNHGERPKDEEFVRVATENRARMAAGEDTAALVAALHDLLAGQAVAEWGAVITAVQALGHMGAGPVGYWGMSLGCGTGVPLLAAEPRVRAAVLGPARRARAGRDRRTGHRPGAVPAPVGRRPGAAGPGPGAVRRSGVG